MIAGGEGVARRNVTPMYSAAYIAFLIGTGLTALGVAAWLPSRLARDHAPMAPPLPDVVHAFRPLPRLHVHTPDVLLIFCLVVSLLLLFLGSPGRDAEHKIVGYIRRACLCFVLRCATASMTVVPAVLPNMSGALGGHDLMFSGHTITFAAIADCWSATGVVPWPVCACVKWLFPWTLVLGRQHYTSDVLVAMAIWCRWAA